MELEMSGKFEKMCRTCMSICNEGNSTLHSIYEIAKNHQNKIFELLQNTVQLLRIERTDKLPKTICEDCLVKLLSCYEFQQCCLNADIHLRKLATDIISSNPAVFLDPLLQDNKNLSFSNVEDFIKQEELDSNVQVINEAINDGETGIDTNLNSHPTPDSVQSAALTPQHIVTASNENSTEMNEVQSSLACTICEKQFSSLKYLRRHIKRIHSNELQNTNDSQVNNEEQNNSKKDNPYKCIECDSAFEKKSYLRKHKYRHKQPGGLKNTKKCVLCEMAFHTVLALKQHYLIEHQELSTGSNIFDITKPYICEFCNKGFQQSCTLKDHKRIHTKEAPFLCSQCGKAFNSNSNLQQHILRHTGEKRYECPDCPKKFPCLSDLFSHKQVHQKLRPHVCDICGAAFGKPYQLKKHKMYHSGEKPYQCEYCEMRFVCADHMRRHMRTHTGEKPYKCKYCTRTFTQSNDMIKHLRSHLGVNVYQCELCPSAFRLAAELREHFALHKNDDDETREQNKRALMEAQEKLHYKLELDRPKSWS